MPPRIPLPPISRGPSERTVAVLDVGTSKVAALVVQVGGTAPPRVIGAGQKPCFGLRRGTVVDYDKAEAAIRGAMDQAERAAGRQVNAVVASFAGGRLATTTTTAEIDIAGASITPTDMVNLRSSARAAVQPGPRFVVHALPALYTLDGLPMVENPLGLHADRLGMTVHVITTDAPTVKNFGRAVGQAHLGVAALIASPLASGRAVLEAEERDIGVALIEIGAGLTSIAVYKFGIAVGVATVPMGGNDITDDITSAFPTRRSTAERTKSLEGAAVPASRDHSDPVLMAAMEDGGDPIKTTRAALVQVIRTRLDMLFADIARELVALGFTGPQARRVVITGGSADLRGLADYAATRLGCNVRIGRPRGLDGLPVAQEGPAFAALAGLALLAAEDTDDLWHQPGGTDDARPKRGLSGVIEKLWGNL
jgi:cell division protein FtsA